MKKPLPKIISVVSNLTRRDVLGLISGTVAVTVLGCWRKQSASTIASVASPAPACTVRPQQTEGPYFVDEKLNRSDIRSDPSDGTIKQGVPLRLVFQVSQIRDRSCTPLNNAIVDVWHCDASGIYSDAIDRNFNTLGKKFLRGYQTTNANGIAEFLTVYPGWYPGRTVHIHFKIRINSASQKSYEFTSQLYFDDALTDRVHAQKPYNARGRRTQRNNRDGIFKQGGQQLMLHAFSQQKMAAMRQI
ncbi:MAG: intradiol ring-cleavage dioxygenase [Oscillatoriales cyanobacterium RU_3_3]|nr:intradiol ring-cleavage dioxygenase [Oscillatoriales cyanobacterium RU_3_3]